MDEVSRTFALVVPAVDAPLSRFLAIAYLICRVADNVEDCDRPGDWKRARFAELAAMMRDPKAVDEVLGSWRDLDWPGLTDPERAMMSPEGGAELWRLYGEMPEPARRTVGHWVLEMADGMSLMEEPESGSWASKPGGVRALSSPDAYNRYCYYVAGTVGHMATDLVVDHYGLDPAAARRLVDLSEACGRGLQKTNIVKDFAEDLRRGVCYLPDEWLSRLDRSPLRLEGAPAEWTREVLADVMADLSQATDYVLALPLGTGGYRRASLLCLLPAYETVLLAARRQRQLFTPEHEVKISRITMAGCVADADRLRRDNDGVDAYRRRAEAAFAEALAVQPASSPP
jgi:farnesyl-diphosphate farnesyltransferase